MTSPLIADVAGRRPLRRLMAPSMAANINPQQTASAADRAVPLALLLFAIGVLLVAYRSVRACGSTTSMPVPSRRSSAPLGLITV